MNDNDTRSNKATHKKKINWWKWSFISLVVLIIIGFGTIFTSVRSVSVNETNVETPAKHSGELVFSTAIEKDDAEHLINSFLQNATTDQSARYAVELTDQLLINGTIEIFTFDVPFTLSFDPYVLENGNIQFRANSVELASFSLPVSAVMSLVTNQLLVPDYMAVDSEAQTIVINLNELSEQLKIRVEMSKIDLEQNEIHVNLFVNEATLIENMNLEVE